MKPRSSQVLGFLWCLLAPLVCAPPEVAQVECLRRPLRSVRRCDQKSALLAAFENEDDCRRHCEQAYIRVSHELLLANERIAQFHLEEVEEKVHDLAGRPSKAMVRKCCCTFEAPWPKFVHLNSIGRDSSDVLQRPGECLPILVSLNLSSRTKRSYEILCSYYNRWQPLTMLELMQFAEAAAYLNFMHPKHPSIRRALRNKAVHIIQKEEINELRRALEAGQLLDIYLPLEYYDGYNLRSGRMRKFLELKKTLDHARKSKIVARAMDELIISNMLMEVAAAAKYLEKLNENELHLPEQLVRGDYDKYDPELAAYFSLPAVNCKLLSDTGDRLQTFLSVLKSLSDSLLEKLIFEHMSEKCAHLVRILEFQKIYKNLHKVNCQKRRA